MTKETAKKISRHITTDEVKRWSSGVSRFSVETKPTVIMYAGKACGECPFRYNISVGGCIGDECPVNAVRKALKLLPKRVSASVKEIYKAKYEKRVLV